MRELMQPITGTMLRPCGRRALYWHRGQGLGYGQKFGVQFTRSGALIVSLYRCGTVMIYKVMHPITGTILTMLPRETTGDDAARYGTDSLRLSWPCGRRVVHFFKWMGHVQRLDVGRGRVQTDQTELWPAPLKI